MARKTCLTKEEFLNQCAEANVSFPYAEQTAILRDQVSIIPGVTAANRLACQAMEGCDGTVSGEPDELTKRRYLRLAQGGAGIIWFEATAVMPEGRANARQLWINKNNLDAFKREVEEIKEAGMKENGYAPLVFMQATHSGRYSKPEGVPAPLIAYNNPLFEGNQPIAAERIVTDEYLDTVRDKLVEGAALAQEAGFDGVDIKCCHRYLNCELLSAYNRPGRYGGSLENRTRLLREAVQGAKQIAKGDFLVSTRMNVYDGFEYPLGFGVKKEGGLEFDPTEAIWILRRLYEYGVRIVNVTMGNPYFNPHVNRPYSVGGYTAPEHPLQGVFRMLDGTRQLKEAVPEMKLICSALSYLGPNAPHVAAGFMEKGGFDFAGFGRTIFAYPDFARDILRDGEMQSGKCCITCSKCTQIMRQKGGTPGCVIRDSETYLPIFKQFCGK